jgi:uncharacterized protein YndB with AHSA1/START domain
MAGNTAMSEPIHQEVLIRASPQRVYAALTDARQFSAFTGAAAAEIARDAGGAFTCFGGRITGRQVELVPGERVVQAWRATHWPAGVFSIVRFELQRQGDDTMLVFDQAGFPADNRDHLESGWHKMYWEPLKTYLA